MLFGASAKREGRTGNDQWAYMQDMKIQAVNNDGTYDIVGKNPHLKREYKTEYCCALRVKECNLERDSDVK